MTATADRSVPRQRRRSGDRSIDGRGRQRSAPGILEYGFRPFFLLAALHAGLAIPAWLWLLRTGVTLPGSFQGVDWHVHEMFFGYLAAVIAGFILTAVPNWTGRLPLSGWPLAGLVGLWLLGRVACLLAGPPGLAMALDLAFPAALAGAIWREVVAGRNWRNAPIAGMLTLFGIANAVHHAEGLGLVAEDVGERLAIGVAVMLIALIGGRIVPSFTRNWLVKRGGDKLPAGFGLIDKTALLATAIAVAFWLAAPDRRVTGFALLAGGIMLALRLVRWRGHRTWPAPIVLILHLGYGWLAVGFGLLGLSILAPGAVPASAGLHALTAGAVGTMTLAVMTRASLGHTGRQIDADIWTLAIYLAVTLGAVLRVAAPMAGPHYLHLLIGGGGLWSFAFLLFAGRYGPFLWRSRKAGAV